MTCSGRHFMTLPMMCGIMDIHTMTYPAGGEA